MSRFRRLGLTAFSVIASLMILALPPPVQAQTWTGGPGGTPPQWNVPQNWGGGTPVSHYDTSITFGFASTYVSAQNLAQPFLLNQIYFDAAAGPYQIGGLPLAFNSYDTFITNHFIHPTIDSSAAFPVVIFNDLTATDSTLTLTTSGAGSITLAGNISNAAGSPFAAGIHIGGITTSFNNYRVPSTVVILSGAANTYTGGTYVEAGILRLGANNAIPTGTNVNIASGTTFDIGTFSNTSATSVAAIILDGTAKMLVGSGSVGHYHTSTLIFTGGTVTDNGQSLNFFLHLRSLTAISTFASNTTAVISLANSSWIFHDGASTAIIGVASGSTASGIDLDIGAVISNNGVAGISFNKDGPGTLRITNIANTACIGVRQGTLLVDNMAALGSGPISLNGGMLKYGGGNQTSAKILELPSLSTINVSSSATTLVLSANLQGSAGLNVTGFGTLELSNPSTVINGPVTLSNGILRSAGSLGDLNITSSAASFVVTGSGVRVNSLNGGGSLNVGSFGITIAGNVNSFYSGALTGSGTLTKAGSSNLTSSLLLQSINIFTVTTPLVVGTTSFNGGVVYFGSPNLFASTVPVVITNGRVSLGPTNLESSIDQAFGSLAGANGGFAAILDLRNATLTVGGNNTNTTFAGLITSENRGILLKVGSGTLELTNSNNGNFSGHFVVSGGTLAITQDGALGSFNATVTVNPAGTLLYTTNVASSRIFDLNGGTLQAANGTTLTFANAQINGGYLVGSFTTTVGALASTSFNGGNTTTGTSLLLKGNDNLTNYDIGGATTVAVGANVGLSRVTNTTSGRITIDGAVNANEFVSNGVLNVVGAGKIANNSTNNMYLGGGSRTTIGANVAGQRTGTILLGGRTLELNGGLIANHAIVANPTTGGIIGGTTNVNFGGTITGAGWFSSVSINYGGTDNTGNSIANVSRGDQTFNGGSAYIFEINRASGTPGGGGTSPAVGWDLLNLDSFLSIGADSENPVIIRLRSRNTADTGPGSLPDFNPTQSNQWLAFHVLSGGTVEGFSPDKFTFDTTQFANLTDPTGVGAFAMTQVGNDMFITYTPVPEPKAAFAIAAIAFGFIGLVRRRFMALHSEIS